MGRKTSDAGDMVESVTLTRDDVMGETGKVLVVPDGRGGRGKTFLLWYLASRAQAAGRSVDLFDANPRNRRLVDFFPDTYVPRSNEDEDVRNAFNKRLTALVKAEGRRGLLCDFGGGTMVFARHAGEFGLDAFCAQFGIRPALVICLGADKGDLDYMNDLMEFEEFLPERCLLVFNEAVGAAAQSVRLRKETMRELMKHPFAASAEQRGARSLILPALNWAVLEAMVGKPGDPTLPLKDPSRPELGPMSFHEIVERHLDITDQFQAARWMQAVEAEFTKAGVADWWP